MKKQFINPTSALLLMDEINTSISVSNGAHSDENAGAPARVGGAAGAAQGPKFE